MTARTFARRRPITESEVEGGRTETHAAAAEPMLSAGLRVVSSSPGAGFAVAGLTSAGAALRREFTGPDPLGGGPAPEGVTDALRRNASPGSALPAPVAATFGGALGTDLSDVRVHTDDTAAGLASSLQARAFTQGSDIFFAKNAYDPESQGGQRLLAHELAHVVQRTAGPSSANGLQVGRANDPVEKDADRIADSVMNVLRGQGSGSDVPAPAAGGPPAVRRWTGGSTIRRFYGVVEKDTPGKIETVGGVWYKWFTDTFDSAVWELSPVKTGWYFRNLYQRKKGAPAGATGKAGAKGLSDVDEQVVDEIIKPLKKLSLKELKRLDAARNRRANNLEKSAQKLKAGPDSDAGTALAELETGTVELLIEIENNPSKPESKPEAEVESETDEAETEPKAEPEPEPEPEATPKAAAPKVAKPKVGAAPVVEPEKPIPASAKQAAAALWALGDRSDFPHIMKATGLKLNSFNGQREVRKWLDGDQNKLQDLRTEWKALQAAAPAVAHTGAAATNGHTAEVNEIFADMQAKFKAWKKAGSYPGRWRGGWWGADTMGSKSGAKSIPLASVPGIRELAEKTNWRYEGSDSGGMSFHRTGADKVDYIYHLQPPAD